jgi:hypothetical protein
MLSTDTFGSFNVDFTVKTEIPNGALFGLIKPACTRATQNSSDEEDRHPQWQSVGVEPGASTAAGCS